MKRIEIIKKIIEYLQSSDYYVLDPYLMDKVKVSKTDMECIEEPFYVNDSWIPLEIFVSYYKKLNGSNLI